MRPEQALPRDEAMVTLAVMIPPTTGAGHLQLGQACQGLGAAVLFSHPRD